MLGSVAYICLLAGGAGESLQLSDPSGKPHLARNASVIVGLDAERARLLSSPAGMDDLSAWLASEGGRIADVCSPLGLIRIEAPAEQGVEAACARLRLLGGVRYAEPDWIGEGGMVPSDTFFSIQWQLQQLGNHDIDAPEAWELTRGSEDVIVAVLDTGIIPTHPEFVGRLLPGKDFVNNDDEPVADHPHGIATTGLLAANGDNNFGVAGVDHRCRILPIKVLDQFNLGTEWALIQGLAFAADHGARVISMSLVNFGESAALKEALQYAKGRGAVLVACSGNGGTGYADISWPGASPLCLTVGATTVLDIRATFSGTGQALDVVAPGKDVVTASADAGTDTSTTFSGCSAATPIVAGVAALLLSADPTLTPDEIQDVIQAGAQDQVGGGDDKQGWDSSYGWGRVNARRSLALLGERFLRGDSNADRDLDISDPLYTLLELFIRPQNEQCQDAMDANDDGLVGIEDAVVSLHFLFLAGSLPAPYPICGLDLTLDHLTCAGGCRR